jgi:carbon storage regulator CsrA
MSRLVLTRRVDESVVIHRDNKVIATVKVSRVDRNQVRLAFVADHTITIDRQEKFEEENPCPKEG